VAEFSGLSRAAARQLAERALALSKAEACQVNINASANGNTRYARNEVTTAGDTDTRILRPAVKMSTVPSALAPRKVA